MLRRRGYEVHPANDIRSALRHCHEEAIRRSRQRYRLPDGSGIDLLKRCARKVKFLHPLSALG